MFLKHKKLIFKRKKLFSVNTFENKKRIDKRKKQQCKKNFPIRCLKLELKAHNQKRYEKQIGVVNTPYKHKKPKEVVRSYLSTMKARNNKGLFKYFIKKFKFFNRSWRYRALIEQRRYPREELGVLFSNFFEFKLLEGKNGFIFPFGKGENRLRQYIFICFLNNLLKKLNYNDYLLN